MRLTNVLLADGTQSNALFPTMTGPIAPLTDVLDEIRNKIRAKTQNGQWLGKDQATLSAKEEEWLESLLLDIAGHRPPFVIGRIPHKNKKGVIDDDVHDLHIFVGKPLPLIDAVSIQAEEGNDPHSLRVMLEQDPLTRNAMPSPHVTAQLYDQNDPNSAFYPMLSDGLAECIDEMLHEIDPESHPVPAHLAFRAQRITVQQMTHIIHDLKEWHLSLALAQQGKIGLSTISARILALDTVRTIESDSHNAFNYGGRQLNWKRDFRMIRTRDDDSRTPLPIAGFGRLNQRRLATLSGWVRLRHPTDLVDQPLPFPRNHEYKAAAQSYADHLEAEVWTAKSSPDLDVRPIRPLDWAHVTEVDKVPMSTAGAVLLDTSSNILETILILEEPGAIITERWAILTGEIPASVADTLKGRPFSDIVDHPLLEPLAGEPNATLVIESVEPLIEQSASRYNKAPAHRQAWQALKQYFSLAKLTEPAFITAMGMTTNSRAKTPIPGCTLVRFLGRPMLGDTQLGTIDIRQRDAAAIKRAIEFASFNK